MALPTLKNIIFDADGTLLESENPYLELAKKLECDSEVNQYIKEYLDQNLEYDELVRLEVELFKNQYFKIYSTPPQVGDIERLLPEVKIREGAKEVVQKLLERSVTVFVVSSGFHYMTKELTSTGINISNIYANKLLYDTSGEFQEIQISVFGDKIKTLDSIADRDDVEIQHTAYTGDNSFDHYAFSYMDRSGGYPIHIQSTESLFRLKTNYYGSRYIEIKELEELLQYTV